MRNELRTMINMTRGPNAWNELLKTRSRDSQKDKKQFTNRWKEEDK